MNLIFLFVGWFLGIASDLVVDRFRKIRQRSELIRAVLTELRDVQVKAALAAYRCLSHVAKLEREFAQWLQPILRGYTGPERDERAIQAFENLLRLSDDQLRQLHTATRRPGGAIRVGKLALPFTLSRLSDLSICPIGFQRRVLQIKSQVDFYNDEVDFAHDNFDRTFDQSITDENRAAVQENLEAGYEKIANRGRLIATAIGQLLESYRSAADSKDDGAS